KVPSGRLVHRLSTRTGGGFCAYTPDGLLLLTSGWDFVLRVWEAEAGRLALAVHHTTELRLGLDGRLWSMTAGGPLRRVEIAPNREYRSLEIPPHRPQIHQIAAHPDGQL